MRPLVLHVGGYKTATTSLQELCARNRGWLRRRGIVYPAMRLGRLPRFSINHRLWAARLLAPSGSSELSSALTCFREQLEPQLAIDGTSLLSAEGLSDVPWSRHREVRADLLRRCLDGFEVRVLLYVRRQDQWYESMHNQRVKTSGETRSLEAYVAAGLERGMADFSEHVRFWRATFGEGRVTVRVFERDQLLDGDVVADFLDQIGVHDREGLAVFQSRNPRLHPALVEPKRRLNVHLKTRVQRQVAKRVALQLQRLLPDDARHTMPYEMALRIMHHHAESNAELARAALGRDDGRLFLRGPEEDPPWQHYG